MGWVLASTGWWVWSKNTRYNFNYTKIKLKLIPAKTELLVEEFAIKLWHIASIIDENFETETEFKKKLQSLG